VRYLLAAIVLGGALAGAVWLHDYRSWTKEVCIAPVKCSRPYRPSWADPAAVGGAVVGLGLAAAILASRGRSRNFAKPS